MADVKMVMLGMTIEAKQKLALEKLSDKTGLPISFIVRKWIDMGLEGLNGAKNPGAMLFVAPEGMNPMQGRTS